MELDIDQNILKQITNCQKNASCLSCDKRDLCKVIIRIGDDMIFVEARRQFFYCNYKDFLGSSFSCTCPARKELYIRYRI